MNLPLVIVTSFLVTLTLIPVIIRVVRSLNVLDKPDKRKIHSISTPSLGGIAMIMGFFIAVLIAVPFAELETEKYFLGAIVMIFLLGVRDDLSSLQANHKLLVQTFAAVMVVVFMDLKIEGLHGLFGVGTFGWYFDELFTIFIIAIMTNAFNLIDGIDGLAGSISLLISGVFCFLFFTTGHYVEASIALAITGTAAAFLLYNWYPSRIFMGDTGSMTLGFLLTVLFVKFLASPAAELGWGSSPVALVLALFLLPVYDTLRVFLIRFLTGKHPLAPDRNHIHHVLLKLGFNHGRATSFLMTYNTLWVILALILQPIGDLWLMLAMTVTTVTTGILLDRKVMKREAARMARLYSGEMEVSRTA